jgi:hypothetical protein
MMDTAAAYGGMLTTRSHHRLFSQQIILTTPLSTTGLLSLSSLLTTRL